MEKASTPTLIAVEREFYKRHPELHCTKAVPVAEARYLDATKARIISDYTAHPHHCQHCTPLLLLTSHATIA